MWDLAPCSPARELKAVTAEAAPEVPGGPPDPVPELQGGGEQALRGAEHPARAMGTAA